MIESLTALEAKITPETQQKLHNASREYESVFLSQMMSIMFENIDLNPLSDNGGTTASDTYKGMLTNEYGKAMAFKGDGIGLAQHMYKSLLETQIATQENAA